MLLPAENRGKVGNIVRKQEEQFKELYHRLVVALPGVHWQSYSSRMIQQDISPQSRAAHLRKLPTNLLTGVTKHYESASLPARESDESVYWARLAGDEKFSEVLQNGEYLLLCGLVIGTGSDGVGVLFA